MGRTVGSLLLLCGVLWWADARLVPPVQSPGNCHSLRPGVSDKWCQENCYSGEGLASACKPPRATQICECTSENRCSLPSPGYDATHCPGPTIASACTPQCAPGYHPATGGSPVVQSCDVDGGTFTMAVPCVADATCGGNCISDVCSTCWCGYSPKPVNQSYYCNLYSDWSQKCCECISSEAAGNANAMQDLDRINHKMNIGLFMINEDYWDLSGGSAPCNPLVNTQVAHQIWAENGNWKPWSRSWSCGCSSSP
eukprot:RCo042612